MKLNPVGLLLKCNVSELKKEFIIQTNQIHI